MLLGSRFSTSGRVGQDVCPWKCALLSTSEEVRKCLQFWDVSGDGRPTVELDVRDLCGHAAVGAQLGLVRGKNLPAGLLAVEASYVSASALSALRAAIVRSVWCSKIPLSWSGWC